MRVNAYLNFDGRCEAALKFYERALGGRLEAKMTWGESPMGNDMPPDWRDKIIHAQMAIGDSLIMASDAPPGRYEPAKGITIALNIDDPAEGKRVFDALSDGGSITMPFEGTFWAEGFGMLTDRFGIPWMVNCAGKMAKAAE